MRALEFGAQRTLSMASLLALRSSFWRFLYICLVFALCSLPNVSSQEAVQFRSCYNADGSPSRCVPQEVPYSLGRPVSVNSTCGNPPSTFCQRVSYLSLFNVQLNCSRVCNASNPALSHPPGALVDFDLEGDTSWQSQTLDINDDVAIAIPLGALVEIELIVINFVSFVPESFYIEKSTDGGITFEPLHYFSLSCLSTYGLTPDGIPPPTDEAQPLCTTPLNSSPVPQLLSFVPTAVRPSANDSVPGVSESVYQLSTATDIRVVLDRQYVVVNQPPSDPEYRDSYYYAISGITVGGTLQCYGHAMSTVMMDGQEVCVCLHNTTGNYCQQCREFYQDAPWQRHMGSDSFIECRICECNNHSTQCEFNATAYSLTGSGGMCLGCRDNTAGQHCDQCARYFYPNTSKELADPDMCLVCGCDPAGVRDSGDCVRVASEGRNVGDCYCKSFTIGRTCGQCQSGYFNLSADNPDGCSECGCHFIGSESVECDQESGVCRCKPNVIGDKCDRCRPGFYNLSSTGCQPCMCVGGASTGICDPVSGQCTCGAGLGGMNCDVVDTGRFVPAMDHLLLEAEFDTTGMFTVEYVTSGEGSTFTGWGFAAVIEGSVVNFGTITVPYGGNYLVAIRYSLSGIDAWQNASLRVRPVSGLSGNAALCLDEITTDTVLLYNEWPMGAVLSRSQSACLQGGQSYEFILSIEGSGAASDSDVRFLIDSIVVIPRMPDQLAFLLGVSAQEAMQQALQLQMCIDSHSVSLSGQPVDQDCQDLFFSVSSGLYNGSLSCACVLGSTSQTCSSFGGQCPCAANIGGRDCSYCVPSFFGLSSDGCRACNCDGDGAESQVCLFDSGMCQCRPFVEGMTCTQCATGYYNLTSGSGCASCGCDPIGTLNGMCDEPTGVCLCREGVDGDQCDVCRQTHYNFSSSGCSPCGCSEEGSVGLDCSNITGQCLCKNLTASLDCSTCSSGTFNLLPTNPQGCQPCFCSGLAVPCTSALGYTEGVVSTTFTITTMHQWTLLTSDLNPGGTLIPDPVTEVVLHQSGLGTYISAPDDYLGNRLSSYGQPLSFTYGLTQNGTISPPPPGVYDALIQGTNGVTIAANFLTIPDTEPTTSSILIQYDGGWINTVTGQPSPPEEILSVLSGIRILAVRVEVGVNLALYNISLVTAVPVSEGKSPVSWVELCSCPLNYSGLSCEDCSPGYYRTTDGSCHMCQCNGFSSTCNQTTGECTNCEALTTGFSCEQCVDGTFGDPLRNISCKPCPCPLTSDPGQFSRTCQLVLPSLEAECLQCPQGHGGRNCESCDNGYYGDPTGSITGSPTPCTDCMCNGNIDISVEDSCNKTSGECLVCTGNTTGTTCQQCRDGFYGDAITAKNCTECGCSDVGSVSGVCDPSTGQCDCRSFVSGRDCSGCIPDYYGYSSGEGCSPCMCNETGSTSGQCRSDTGQCTCKPLVTGQMCDQCTPGAYNFTATGCTACNCSLNGTEDRTCSLSDGQCVCRYGYMGLQCANCAAGFFQKGSICETCPQCYLQVHEMVNASQGMLTNLSAILSELELSLSGEGSFASRLTAIQIEVDSQMNLAQSLKTNDTNLEALISHLNSLLSQLSTNISQASVMLGTLNGTTTLTQARVGAVESILNSLQSMLTEAAMLVDSMTATAEAIASVSVQLEDSSVPTASTALEVSRVAQMLAQEAKRLVFVSVNATATASVASRVSTETSSAQAETSVVVMSLLANSSVVQSQTSSLTSEVNALLVRSQDVQSVLEAQLMEPFSPLHGDLIESTSSLFTVLMQRVVQIQGELVNANATLAVFGDTLQELTRVLDSLIRNVTAGLMEAKSLDSRVSIVLNSSLTLTNSTNFLLSEAQELVVIVEEFDQRTSSLEAASLSSLDSVSNIRDVAHGSLRLSLNITTMLSDAAQILSTAHMLSIELQHVASELEQNVTGFNITSSVGEEMRTASQLLSFLVAAIADMQLSLRSLHNQSSNLDGASNLTNMATLQTAESAKSQEVVNGSLSSVLAALSTLETINSTLLEEVTTTVVRLTADISSTNLTVAMGTLEQQLVDQRVRNDNLTSALTRLEDELSALRLLYRSLPTSCGGNM